jgi:membrane fusion protein, multidrug efflux system
VTDQKQIQEPPGGAPPVNAAAAAKRPVWGRRPVIFFGTVVLAGLSFLGLGYLAEGLTHESTDDAFLDGNIVSLAPRVAGQVKKVHVADNQKVKAGDLLVEIEPQDFAVQQDQKKAAVQSAQANTELLKSALELVRAQVASAEAIARQTVAEAAASRASAEKAKADFKRAEELSRNGTIAPQEFDAAKSAAVSAEANLKAAEAKAASEQAKVAQALAQVDAARKAYERAEVQTRQAEWDVRAADLNLSYCRVTAPQNGYVTKKAVQSGDYVQVGQRLMALVPEQLYVTANFKETQLQHIRPGQPVKIVIDAVEKGPFTGKVESIMAGGGARFSLLPPENAVGNYVKVVQRVPVKIVFDGPIEAGQVLGPGMSVVPLVKVTDWEVSETVVALAAGVLALGVGGLWWWRAGVKRKT